MEDFKVINDRCKDIRLVSIERDLEIFKRQQNHLPTSDIELNNVDLFEFVDGYDSTGDKSIFWLDFTDLEYQNFECFERLLRKVGLDSMIKVTLRAHAGDYRDCIDCKKIACACVYHSQGGPRFRSKFGRLMPNRASAPPRQNGEFGKMVQDMLRISAQRALKGDPTSNFQLINSFLYSDGTWMFTATGIVCSRRDQINVRNMYEDWDFANFDWSAPRRLRLPVLSTKERLQLQNKLPFDGCAGMMLRNELDYLIAEKENETIRQLQDYAEFHEYYPYFMQAVP